ncbi:antibiotic biosynthesis monooxygenase family protein [Azonexus fungiphilus]|uniref:antibiotic biosynthesis monooxygenase family protein n=1 Tax=Azonexus fungiphilus TaxID=146940 RepID=UPI0020C4B689|nr:antibiotic biosynthesis monooxygenase [Azonexus fungiphilus]
MYSSTFIFGKKQFDAGFHQLDQAIAEAAKEIPGYLGEEAWENPQTGLFANVDYWESLDALHALMQTPPPPGSQAGTGGMAGWLRSHRRPGLAHLRRQPADGAANRAATGLGRRRMTALETPRLRLYHSTGRRAMCWPRARLGKPIEHRTFRLKEPA